MKDSVGCWEGDDRCKENNSKGLGRYYSVASATNEIPVPRISYEISLIICMIVKRKVCSFTKSLYFK